MLTCVAEKFYSKFLFYFPKWTRSNNSANVSKEILSNSAKRFSGMSRSVSFFVCVKDLHFFNNQVIQVIGLMTHFVFTSAQPKKQFINSFDQPF